MKLPVVQNDANATPSELVKKPDAEAQPKPEAWEAFLEEDADCCGGCHHKPR